MSVCIVNGHVQSKQQSNNSSHQLLQASERPGTKPQQNDESVGVEDLQLQQNDFAQPTDSDRTELNVERVDDSDSGESVEIPMISVMHVSRFCQHFLKFKYGIFCSFLGFTVHFVYPLTVCIPHICIVCRTFHALCLKLLKMLSQTWALTMMT